MADMRGKYKRAKTKKPIGRPVGSRTLFTYDPEYIKGLPKQVKYLSPAEIKVIRGLLDPEIQSLKTTREKYKTIGVTQGTYYKALKNPIVIDIINEQAKAMIRADVLDLIKSSLKFAKDKSSAFQDRKMLYQMLGFLGEDGSVNINLEQQKQANPFEGLSLQELKGLAAGYLNGDFIETEFEEVKGNE